jgi:hypothetical protein
MSFDPTTAPVAGKEPMLLLDVTGSMNWAASESTSTARKTVIQEAISLVVEALAKEDSEAAHEESGGGLRTVTFANGKATDIDDLNPGNLRAKWEHIVWDGGTLIMPGWNKLMEVYADEFGDKPASVRPKLMALVITDGEARDFHQFTQTLQGLGGNIYVELAIIGYGSEHDNALKDYQSAADKNPGHVEVRTFGSQTDPQQIANGLLQMIS